MTGPADSRRDIMAFDLGTRIVELRGARGLSQEALANELGISRQAVSRWERGEALPDTENLIALADLFGVTLDELARGSSSEQEVEARAETAPVADPCSNSPDESGKRRLKAIGMALIFVGMALIFLGTILRFSNFAPDGGSPISPATDIADLPPVEREEDILADGVTSLDISWPAGQVTVVAGTTEATDGTIRIHEDRSGTESEDALRWEIDRGTLRIYADPGTDYIGGTSITVTIPYEAFVWLSSVSVEVLDGSICVQGIVPAALTVAMRNGMMQVVDVDVAELRVEQGAGEAHVIGRFGAVDARISGDADAELAVENSDALSISAEVTSGRLALLLPEDMGFTVTQQIDGPGAFETGFPIAYDEAGGHVGDGTTAIDLRQGEGDVVITPV